MKTNKTDIVKQTYKAPLIERIELNNEISLALESSPPDGPGETSSLTPEYMKNNPFKNGNI